MSKGQAPPSRAQPQDVAATPVPSAEMVQPPSLPALSTSTLTRLSNNASRDVDNNSNNINVNISSSSYNVSDSQASDAYLHRQRDHFGPDVTWQGSTTDDFLKSEEEFYSSYNPQIGLHTAAVLGGILGWLVVYLLYKTKVKKCVVRFVRKKYNQRKSRRKNLSVCSATGGSGNNESSAPPLLYKDNFSCFNHSQQQHNQLFQQPFPPHQQQFSQGQPGKNGDFSQTIPYTLCGEGAANLEDNLMGIQCPMPSIVVESCSSLPPKTTTKRARYKHKRAARSLDRKESSEKAVEQGEDHKRSGHKTRRKNRHEKKNYKQGDKNKKFNRKRSRSYSHQCPEVTVLDVDELDTKSLLLPPSSETDSARATARWVQNMPLLMQSYQDFTGLILKIEPNLVNQHKPQSCPLISAALQYAALPLPLLGLPNVSHLNKSMPLLTENGPGGHKDNELDSIFSDEKGSLGNHAVRLSPVLQPQKVHHLPQHQQPERSASPASRPHTSLSCTHSAPPQHPPSYSTSSRPPPPRLTISIPDQTLSASATNLSVPSLSPNPFLNPSAAMSAPASPVPIPVTPTVTIQNFTSRVSRSMPLHRRDSEDSMSSNSSIDPLLHSHEHKPLPHHHYNKPPMSPSWIVFDDDPPGLSVGHSPQCPSNGSSARISPRESCQNNATSRTSDTQDTPAVTLETRL